MKKRASFFALSIFLGAQLSWANPPKLAKNPPRLPELTELKKSLGNHLPERLEKALELDKFSSCEILLMGEGASIYFPNLMAALGQAGITRENMTQEERNYLLNSLAYFIALKLRQGGFSDLKGIDEVLQLTGVEEFKFGEEYLSVIRYWLQAFPNWDFYISNCVHNNGDQPSRFSGRHINKTFVEPDYKKRNARFLALETEDYRAEIKKLSNGAIQPSDQDMKEFMEVNSVLLTLSRALRLKAARPAKSQLGNANLLPESLPEILKLTESE